MTNRELLPNVINFIKFYKSTKLSYLILQEFYEILQNFISGLWFFKKSIKSFFFQLLAQIGSQTLAQIMAQFSQFGLTPPCCPLLFCDQHASCALRNFDWTAIAKNKNRQKKKKRKNDIILSFSTPKRRDRIGCPGSTAIAKNKKRKNEKMT